MAHCSQSYIECRISEWMWRIIPAVLLIIGTLGNALNITILSRRTLRGYSTSVYLLVLAVSDLLALWTVLPESTFIFLLEQNYLSISILHCKFTSWLAYSSSAVSAWTVVNLTIERVLMTLYPMKAKAKLSPKVSLVVSLVTMLTIQLFTIHLILGHAMTKQEVMVENRNQSTTVSTGRCELVSQEYREFFNTTWSYIVLICFSVLPISIIITGNGIIGYVLLKRKRQIFPKLNLNQVNMTREKLAVKMLFIISCYFIICTSPYCIYSVIKSYSKGEVTPRDKALDSLIHVIVSILLFSNFTFNFILYFARGKLFRQEWTKIVTSCVNYMKARRPTRSRQVVAEIRTLNTNV